MSLPLLKKGKFHTINGDVPAQVIDNDAKGSSNPDDNLEVAVWVPRSFRTDGTGLDHGLNFRYTHENDQAGGFTPA